MNVYEKLQEARIRLQEMNVKKSGKNKFSGFIYYELSDFMPQINRMFKELKLCGNFSVKEREAQLTIVNCEKPEEAITFASPTTEVTIKGCTGIQGIGAVHTYMRRYLYMNALEIVENDELDARAGKIEEADIKAPAGIDYLGELERDIQAITNVDKLNATYARYKTAPPKDENWKLAIKAKAEYLGASYDKAAGKFLVYPMA
jgi:hypothetical protein